MRPVVMPFASARLARAGATLLTAGAVVLAGLAPAQGADTPEQASSLLSFACTTAKGNKTFTALFDTDAPVEMYVGDAAAPINLTSTVTLPNGGYVNTYWWLAKRKVAGPLNFTTTTGETQRTTSVALAHANPDSWFGAGSTWPIGGTANIGSFTPTRAGDVPITVGNFSGTLTWRDGYNNVPVQDTVSCSPAAGQNNTIDSIRVISRSQIEIETPIATVEQGSGARVSAQVSLDGGTVAGTVRFTSGSHSVDAPVDSTGRVSATLPVLPPGAHSVRATFLPADSVHYVGSTSSPEPFTVAAATATSIALTAPASAMTTDTVQVRAVVGADGSSDVPVGRVDFLLDNAVVATSSVSGAGVATAMLTGLSAGQRVVKARFVPTNPNRFQSAESSERTIEVSVPATATQTVLQVEPDTVSPTQRAMLNAQVFADSDHPLGDVEFVVENDEGWFETYTAALANGAASVQLPVMPQGDYRVSAAFLPSSPDRFTPSTSATRTLSVKVTPAVATTSSVQLAPSTTFPGESVEATIDVAALSGSAAPQGVVTLAVGGRTETGTLTNGRVVLTFPAPNGAQQYPVVASFASADTAQFLNSQSPARILTVQARPAVETQTSLSLSRASVTEGGAVTATATLTPANANGRVEFTVDGSVLSGAVVNGEATVSLPELAIGTYDVRARFVPADAALFTASTSPIRQLSVERRPAATTTTTLGLSRTTASNTQQVVATAEVASDYGRPSGTVTFVVGAHSVVAPVVGGHAEAPLPGLAAGTHNVQAHYTSDDALRFVNSVATPLTLTIEQAPAEATVTTLRLLRNPVVSGQRAEARVEVAATAGEVNGTATVTVNGLTETVTITSGVGTLTLPAVSAMGNHEVVATFVPAVGANLRSSSDTRTLQVVAGPTHVDSTTVLTLERSGVEFGDPVRATATVAAPGVAAAGQVEFRAVSGANVVTLSAPVNGGEATVAFPELSVGSWSITAAFVPTGTVVQPSASAPVQVSVSPATARLTHTEVTLDRSAALRGEAVTATASVTSRTGTPTGQVAFTVGGVETVVSLSNGSASVVLPALTTGLHQVVASFTPGDPTRFIASSSQPRELRVQDASTLVLSLSAASTASDRPVVATATVSGSGGTPAGTVRFDVGGRSVSGVLVNGTVSASLPSLAPGEYQVRATYVPVSEFQRGASSSQPLVVTAPIDPPVGEPADTPLNLTTDLTSAPYGKRVTAVAQLPAGAAGIVTFAVGGAAAEVTVVNGRATTQLPVLAVGTHEVSATYLPSDPQSRKPATARVALGVVKDSVRISFGKRWSKADRLLTHKTRVRPTQGSLAEGTVKVVLEKKVGKKFRKLTTHKASLSGNGFVQFTDKLAKPATGTYRVRITYSGSSALGAATFTKSFRIG